MTQKLAEVTRPDWKDPPLNPAWKQPDAATVKQIEDAGGMLAERFAMCHSLPLTSICRRGRIAARERLSANLFPPLFRPASKLSWPQFGHAMARIGNASKTYQPTKSNNKT